MNSRIARRIVLAAAMSMTAPAASHADPNSHWPSATRVDPLRDLRRPSAPHARDGAHHNDGGEGLDAAGIELRSHFCSEGDKAAYLARVQAVEEQAFRSVDLYGAYRAAIAKRALEIGQQLFTLRHEGTPGSVNPNVVAELQREIDVVELEIAAFEPTYQRAADYFHTLIKLDNDVMSARIEDCSTASGATPNAPASGDDTAVPPPWPQEPVADVPDSFCSDKDRFKWIKDVLDPLDDKANTAVQLWSRYLDTLTRRYGANSAYAERIGYAQRGVTLSKRYSDKLQNLYDKAHRVDVRDCDPKLHLGIGFSFGSSHDSHRPERGPPDQYHGEEGRPPEDNQIDGERPPAGNDGHHP